jgi:hypothetical protein
MPSNGSISAIVNVRSQMGAGYKGTWQVGTFAVSPFDVLVGRKKTLIELLKYLPDLADELSRFGVYATHCRSDLEVIYADVNRLGPVDYVWRLHGCRSPSDLESILNKFAVPSGFTDAITCTYGGANGALVRAKQGRAGAVAFTWPDSRDTMNCDTISYEETIDSLEIVDLYLVSYQLSMLSRYFPDIWVRCIESQCRAAKLVERAVDVIVRKMPMLTLSYISPEDFVISTHLPPWKV